MNGPAIPAAAVGPPYWLLAELTYRCPLHCVFCYNPVDFASHERELGTDDWIRVLREARAAGSVQCGFSGGEPVLRDDLEVLVAEAHRLGFYTNLLTSGVGLNDRRVAELKRSGLDHIQLSFQDSTRELNDFLSHTRTFDLKQRVARMIKANGWPMVLNCVIHRLNIDYIGQLIEMAVALEADYLELANSQYYSWAHLNRAELVASIDRAFEFAATTEANANQGGLFDMGDSHAASTAEPPLVQASPWGVKERLTHEKTAVGFYLSGHLFDEVE